MVHLSNSWKTILLLIFNLDMMVFEVEIVLNKVLHCAL